jgi:hypothetical protein
MADGLIERISCLSESVQALGMRAGLVVSITPKDFRRLEGVVRDRNRRQQHVARALALLATVGGCGTNQVIRRSGPGKPAVWRWRARFRVKGVDEVMRN